MNDVNHEFHECMALPKNNNVDYG